MPFNHRRQKKKKVTKLPFKLQEEKIQIESKFQDTSIYGVYS